MTSAAMVLPLPLGHGLRLSKDLGQLDRRLHNWLMPHQVFSSWHNRRLVERVMVVGVALHNICELRLGILAIVYGLQYLQHHYLSRKILALLASAKIPRQWFHQLFLE
ncbi:MAG: hypothetical protein V7K89_29390 [Nostoc sp.]|uniref:hypothetical protein n=1 Tax=Nostoc sp. TaxID=1180 RepID=UPI002FFC2C2C